MFKGNGFATCLSFLVCLFWGRGFCLGSFFAGSLFFDGQYGDVSNILQKQKKTLIAFNCRNLSGSL